MSWRVVGDADWRGPCPTVQPTYMGNIAMMQPDCPNVYLLMFRETEALACHEFLMAMVRIMVVQYGGSR